MQDSLNTLRERAAAAHAEDSAVKTGAARLSIATAAFLILIKTATGFKTGSISVWASLLDSAMDIFASLINLYAVRAAARPADEDHAYGHGKAESLAGLFQGAVIAASGFYLVWEAFKRIVYPRETTAEGFGIASMLLAVAASAFLVFRLRRAARSTDSPALAADALHYASDIYTNAAALAALVVVYLTNWRVADPLFSIAISIYILASAFSVARESVDVLMDKKLPPEVDEKVSEIVHRYKAEGVLGVHDIRTRRSGSLKFIDMHLEVDRAKTLEQAHDLTVNVMRDIETEIPRSRVQAHTDPAG
ncbi:MAG TPA: cation diffusion facilitator family transporter [Pyrinomonadaceae bacterium]|nr:cation diffusion facilitator family transporter [Pyrinomonadaceae bacterium]